MKKKKNNTLHKKTGVQRFGYNMGSSQNPIFLGKRTKILNNKRKHNEVTAEFVLSSQRGTVKQRRHGAKTRSPHQNEN